MYELVVEKQGREKRQGGWTKGNYHWYRYGSQGWRIRPALVLLRGDGGDIRVPATCETAAQAVEWLRPKGAIARQGHLYFVPVREADQDVIACEGPSAITGDESHVAECSAFYHGQPVYSGFVDHVGGHERIYLPRWCKVVQPRSFATQYRRGD